MFRGQATIDVGVNCNLGSTRQMLKNRQYEHMCQYYVISIYTYYLYPSN